ncbi:hypothetical protein CHU98_g7388 [Xylaria longipes]|nr:hypothetical protein CHU98_g7388 [Xylaria longipes]
MAQTLFITGKNTSNSKVTVQEVETHITTGTSKSSLFRNDDFHQADGTAVSTGYFWLNGSSPSIRRAVSLGYVASAPSYSDDNTTNKDNNKQTP